MPKVIPPAAWAPANIATIDLSQAGLLSIPRAGFRNGRLRLNLNMVPRQMTTRARNDSRTTEFALRRWIPTQSETKEAAFRAASLAQEFSTKKALRFIDDDRLSLLFLAGLLDWRTRPF